MEPWAAIAAFWLLFALTHTVLSSVRLRRALVGALGEQGFMGGFSLIALATFVPLCWIYFANEHTGPLLWAIPIGTALRWAIYVGMGVALVLLVAGVVTPSPASIGADAVELRGVHRITRHGVFMGAGLFGLLHLIPNGFASDVAFFGGFPVFAIIGGLHQDRRKLAEPGEKGDRFRAFHAGTPFLPFSGGESLLGLRELSRVALLVGIALAVLLRWAHPWLF